MNRFRRFLAFVCLACPTVALAQNAQLSGVVQDKTGAVVPQAEVTLTNTGTAAVLHSKTSKVGFFIFSSLQPGRYNLSAEAAGFDKTLIQNVKVDVAANVSLDMILQIRQGAEQITVTEKAEASAADGTVSTVIRHELIENMPLNGNDLTTLFELSPGTLLNAGGGAESNGGGFSVDGQRPTANYVTIDGTSANAYVPATTGTNNTGSGIATSASGGTSGILPIDAIEEYRMDTSTYTAENGRTPGGQVEVRTRGGTNYFHGSLFENFRSQVLDANDWFSNYDNIPQSALHMNEFGGTLGGPVRLPKVFDGRNTFFFFVATDALLLDQPLTTTETEVPDQSLLQGAFPTFAKWMSVFPKGNGGQVPNIPSWDYYNASFPYLVRDYTTSVRLDWQLPRSIHAFVRSNVAPSTATDTGVQQGTEGINHLNSYSGGLTVPWKDNLVDDLAVNYTSNNTQQRFIISSVDGNSPDALRENLPTGVSSQADEFQFFLYSPGYDASASATSGSGYRNQLHQWNLVDKVSVGLGKHSLKFGADVARHEVIDRFYDDAFAPEVETGISAPYTATNLDIGMINTLYFDQNIAPPTVKLLNLSLFANDDWSIVRSLKLNYGLRWELDPAPSVAPLGAMSLVGDSLNPATFQAAVSRKPLYRTVYDNIAPRLGFAWTPRAGSETLVRGGVGIYFDTGQAGTTAGVSSSTAYPYEYSGTFSNVSYTSVDWGSLSAVQSKLAQSTLWLDNPHLLSPRTYEWSLTLEQEIAKSARLVTSYVGNDGEKLIGEDRYYNAKSASGLYPVNSTYVTANGSLYYINNESHSNYQGLQVQLVSRLGSRLNALASYTWQHVEDNGSTDFTIVGNAARNPMASSTLDIRQMFSTAIHWAPAGVRKNGILKALTGGWALDTIIRLQTALPLTVTVANNTNGNVNNFLTNADTVAGERPILHEHLGMLGKAVPGNRLLNWAAFKSPPVNSNGIQIRQGDSPTNGYRLFGLTQFDLAGSRSWKVFDGLDLICRVDAFNLVNTPNFANVLLGWTTANSSTFGRSQATYAGTYGAGPGAQGSGVQSSTFENGGPRELQVSLKLKF